jgi:hypothetical protein
MYQIPALCQLLVEAGFSQESATRITDALDALESPGCEGDNVASVLYKWRTKCVRTRLAECRKQAATIYTANGDRDAERIAHVIAVFQQAFNSECELFAEPEGHQAII